jgi:hypothetical protein
MLLLDMMIESQDMDIQKRTPDMGTDTDTDTGGEVEEADNLLMIVVHSPHRRNTYQMPQQVQGPTVSKTQTRLLVLSPPAHPLHPLAILIAPAMQMGTTLFRNPAHPTYPP